MKYLILFVFAVASYTRGYCQTELASYKVESRDRTSQFFFGPLPLNKVLPDHRRFLFKSFKLSAPTTDKFNIDFVGTGDIQKTISEGEEVRANTGLGIILERYRGTFTNFQSLEFESYLNIFTTADTISGTRENGALTNRRQFSSYLLNPISAKQSVFINANIYFGYLHKKGPDGKVITPTDPLKRENLTKFAKFARIVSGLNGRFIASNNVWQIGDTARNLGGMYLRLGVFHEIVPDGIRVDAEGRSKYSCFIGINYTMRKLFGDLSSDANDGIREVFLGTDRKTFNGVELNFGFRLKNLRAEFQMPVLSAKKQQVEGLTNTQFLFSIKFVGGFGLKLDEGKTGAAGAGGGAGAN